MMNDISLYEKIPSEKNGFPVRILLQEICVERLIPHWHEHMEMLFFYTGSCQMTCGQNSFTANKGDLVFINSSELHFFDKANNVKYICVILHPKIFEDIDFKDMFIKNLICSDKNIEAIFSSINKEFHEQKKGYDMAIKGLVYGLMTYISRNYAQRNKFRSIENEMIKKRINEVLEYISCHYADNLTTAVLSKKWYLSEYYFCRFFKNATGQSPVNYINRTRIEKAAVLLRETNENITNIAIKVGYDDINYFSRTFKKFMNVSPSEYRKIRG